MDPLNIPKRVVVDPFQQNSTRLDGQLLEPGLYIIEETVTSDPSNDDWRFDDAGEHVRQAEGMVHYLKHQSPHPALLIAEYSTDEAGPPQFENEMIFRQVAARNGCVVQAISQPSGRGMRHMLFLGRDTTVMEADYLNSLPARVPQNATVIVEEQTTRVVSVETDLEPPRQ